MQQDIHTVATGHVRAFVWQDRYKYICNRTCVRMQQDMHIITTGHVLLNNRAWVSSQRTRHVHKWNRTYTYCNRTYTSLQQDMCFCVTGHKYKYIFCNRTCVVYTDITHPEAYYITFPERVLGVTYDFPSPHHRIPGTSDDGGVISCSVHVSNRTCA